MLLVLNTKNITTTGLLNNNRLTLSAWVLTFTLLLNNAAPGTSKMNHFGLFQLLKTPDLRLF